MMFMHALASRHESTGINGLNICPPPGCTFDVRHGGAMDSCCLCHILHLPSTLCAINIMHQCLCCWGHIRCVLLFFSSNYVICLPSSSDFSSTSDFHPCKSTDYVLIIAPLLIDPWVLYEKSAGELLFQRNLIQIVPFSTSVKSFPFPIAGVVCRLNWSWEGCSAVFIPKTGHVTSSAMEWTIYLYWLVYLIKWP